MKSIATHHFLIVVIIGVTLFLLSPVKGEAMVQSGVCSDCHTMHDSQDNVTMKLDSTPVTGSGVSECYDCHAKLRPDLLRMDCIGCHVQGVAGFAAIINDTPQIAYSTATTDLAAGNFAHVFTDDANGHNVHGFPHGAIGPDGQLANTPPGYNAISDPSTGKYNSSYITGQVMCAGQNGCHGNRDELSPVKAVKGAHHYNDNVLHYGGGFNDAAQGTTVGNSYRFLYKVHGAEDDDWQDTIGANDHNEYLGAPFAAGRNAQTWADIKTMSQLCAECHGNFHSGAGLRTSNMWIRHPSDVVMPNSPPFDGVTTFNPMVPVAKPSFAAGLPAASGTVTPGTDIVFCLSCHTAHASEFPSMLRWDYNTCFGSDPGHECGGYTCHNDHD
jgi:predicted CXXCH cytochrome family protein